MNCEKSSFNLLFFLFIFNYFAREFSAAQIEFAEQKVNLSLRDELLRELTRDFISIMQFCDCSIGRQFRCLSRIEQWRMMKSEATSTVLNRYLVSMQWQICTINCRMMGDKKNEPRNNDDRFVSCKVSAKRYGKKCNRGIFMRKLKSTRLRLHLQYCVSLHCHNRSNNYALDVSFQL